MGVVERAADLPVLRPLVAWDKAEIVKEAEEIGTLRGLGAPGRGLLHALRESARGDAGGARRAEHARGPARPGGDASPSSSRARSSFGHDRGARSQPRFCCSGPILHSGLHWEYPELTRGTDHGDRMSDRRPRFAHARTMLVCAAMLVCRADGDRPAHWRRRARLPRPPATSRRPTSPTRSPAPRSSPSSAASCTISASTKAASPQSGPARSTCSSATAPVRRSPSGRRRRSSAGALRRPSASSLRGTRVVTLRDNDGPATLVRPSGTRRQLGKSLLRCRARPGRGRHLRGRDAADIRIDEGKVVAVRPGSITLLERDGTRQAIAVASSTAVTQGGQIVDSSAIVRGLTAIAVRDGGRPGRSSSTSPPGPGGSAGEPRRVGPDADRRAVRCRRTARPAG